MWFAICPRPKCGRELIRYIENPADPWFRVSRRARAERRKYRDFLIQPDHPDFDILYPGARQKFEEDKLKQEAELMELKQMKEHDFEL